MLSSFDYQLYGDYGDRYDLHTPARHYKHDHDFVLELAERHSHPCKFLDIGCGTGVLLDKAIKRGIDAYGFDPAEKMLKIAQQRVGKDRAFFARMQDLDENEEFNCIASMSWSLNYCQDLKDLERTLELVSKAIKPGGVLVLQVAHAANAAQIPMDFKTDYERGPGGPEDIQLSYRFWAAGPFTLKAEYRFHCISESIDFQEIHTLEGADVHYIGELLASLGFHSIRILDDCHGSTLEKSLSPFVIATRPI